MSPDPTSTPAPSPGASGRAASEPAGLPRIPGFRLRRLLGAGATSDVFEAVDDASGTPVALKMIRAEAATRPDRRRFTLEGEILARLSHPGIARVFGGGTASVGGVDRAWLAMELVRGVPIHEHVRLHVPDVRGRVALLAQAADAVAHAHTNGVIHRDLKPGNLLVDGAGRVKVVDFGIARSLDALTPEEALRTGAGDLLGTLAYMSPEQAAGRSASADTRSDVYALGVVAFEVLGGRLPREVTGRSLPAVLAERAGLPAPSLRRLAPSVPVEVAAIVGKSLEIDAGRRYAGAAELAADLARWLRGEPVLARPATAPARLAALVHRHRIACVGLCAAFLALLAGLVVSLRFAVESERDRRAADESLLRAKEEAYRAQLAAAAQSLRGHDGAGARDALERAPAEHRDWAWRWLEAQLDEAVERIEFEIPIDPPFAVTPDGERCAGTSENLDVVVVRADTGRVAARHRVGSLATHVALSPRGLRVATSSTSEGFRLFDGAAGPGTPPAPLDPRLVPGPAAFADDGRFWIRTRHGHGAASRSVLERVERPGDEPTVRTETEDFDATVVAIDPTGRAAAVGGTGRSVRIVATGTLSRLRTLTVAAGGMRTLAFSPDGRWLAVAPSDRTVRIHDATTGAEAAVLRGHVESVTSIGWSPDSARLATASSDGTVRAWRRSRGEAERIWLARPGERDLAVAFAADGLRVHGFDRRGRSTWWAGSADTFDVLRGHRGVAEGNHWPYVYAVAFSPDGARIATVGWDGALRIRSARTLATLAAIETEGPIHALAWSPDGRAVAVAGRPGRTEVYDADTGALRARRTDTTNAMAGPLAWSKDGGRVLAAADDGAFLLLESADLSTVVRFDAPAKGKAPGHGAFSPDGALVASIARGAAGTIRDVRTGAIVRRLDVVADTFGSVRVVWSPRGDRLAIAAGGRVVEIVDAASGRRVRTLEGHAALVHGLAFSEDGRRLATGSNDQTIRVFDLGTGACYLVLEGHDSYVYGLDFSPDGRTLASASGDNTVRLWSTRRFRERFEARERGLALDAEVEPRLRAALAGGVRPEAEADRLRADPALDDERRRAALDAILRLSAAARR